MESTIGSIGASKGADILLKLTQACFSSQMQTKYSITAI
jgi:hypothetical protein